MATSQAFSTSNQYIKYRIVVTEVSQDIVTNKSVVNVKVQAWRTNQGYTTDGSGYCYTNTSGDHNYSSWSAGQKPISYNSYTTLFDQNITTEHESDGSKNLYVSAYIEHSRFSSNDQGFNVQLTRIPRQANLTAAPNFYDTDNPTITYNNPAGNAVTSLQAAISLTGSRDDIAYRDISKTGTSYTFNLTQAERNTLLAACPNSNTLSVKFYVKTVLAGQTYYSILTRTMTVKNANPTITGASYADTNTTTTAITNNNQQIIQDNSIVRFTFSNLAALKYATLSKVEITVNTVKVTSNLSGSSVNNKTVDFGTINSSSNLSASIKLTDSRGNSTTQSLNITILAWSLPTAIISLSRKSNYYDETYLNVNADYSSLNNKNSITIQYQYKETTASVWSALTTIQDDVTETISLDNTKSFNIRVIVTDRIGSSTYNLILPVGIPIMFIDRKLRSVGVGTIPSNPNYFEVGGSVLIKHLLSDANIYFYHSTNGGAVYLRNASSKNVVRFFGRSDGYGGTVSVENASGSNRAALTCDANGGRLTLMNNSDKAHLYLYPDSSGKGVIQVNSNDGSRRLLLWVGSNNDGVFTVYNSSGSSTISNEGQSGKITCVSLVQTSSRKVKENIKQLTSEEAIKILSLEAVTFDFKDRTQGENKRGFIAEDVAEVIPELVTPETENTPASLDYIEMIPYLQAVIKEQDKRIKALEDKVEELTKKLT